MVRRGRLSAGLRHRDHARAPSSAASRSPSRWPGWPLQRAPRAGGDVAGADDASRRARASRWRCRRASRCGRSSCCSRRWRSFLIASFASSQWMTLLAWWHQVPFGKADPVLGHDAALYVFTLPALELLRGVLLGPGACSPRPASPALYFVAGQVALTPFGLRVEHARAATWPGWRPRSSSCSRSAPGSSRLQEIVIAVGHHPGRELRRRARAHAGGARPDGRVAGRRGPGGRHRARPIESRRVLITAPRSTRSCCSAAKATPALLQRFAVTPNEQVRETPFMEYNIAATREAFALDRVEERELRGEATLTRAGHRSQPRDARQRAAVGSPAAARDVRADPGDPHLLRLRLGRQRSLPDQRPEPAGDAVGARAQSGGAAQSHLGQRAARLHARPRPDAGPGQPGDERRPAGAVRPRPAAGHDRRSARSPSRASTSASSSTTT